VRRAGRSSWQVVEDEPTDLHLVLFVRDGFRLAVDAPDVVRADAEGAVVSGELIASEPRYAQWLHAVLGPLA